MLKFLGVLVFCIGYFGLIVTGHGNAADPDEPPAALVIALFGGAGIMACGGILGWFQGRREDRDWFTKFKE